MVDIYRNSTSVIDNGNGITLLISIFISEQNPASASSTALSTISYTRWWSPRDDVLPIYIPGLFRTASRLQSESDLHRILYSFLSSYCSAIVPSLTKNTLFMWNLFLTNSSRPVHVIMVWISWCCSADNSAGCCQALTTHHPEEVPAYHGSAVSPARSPPASMKGPMCAAAPGNRISGYLSH